MTKICFWQRLFFVAALLCLSRGARAQDYRLGPQDVLSVTVLRHPELSAERVEVDPGGRIRLPFVGSLVVAGQTTGQVTARIRQGLLRQLREPTVTLSLLQTRPQRIAVSGAVKTPGLFDIGQNWRISEAIAAAGGLTAASELLSASFSRQGGRAVSIDLGEVLRNGGSPENRRLRAGDTLRLSENSVPVLLAGQVKTPGTVNVPRGGSLRDAIALAGGFAPGAAQSRVALTHKNGATTTVDLRPGTRSIAALPGDLIVVSPSNDRVSVLGAVARPGDIALEADKPLTLSQAIIQAGGADAGAALTEATLTRQNGATVPLDLYGLTVLGDQTKNLTLQPGDVITLPQARGVTIYGAVAKPGTYPLQAARAPRVLDAITAAGGLSAPPSQSSIRLSRSAAATNPPVAFSASDVFSAPAAPPRKRTLSELLAQNSAPANGAPANGVAAATASAAPRTLATVPAASGVPNGFDQGVLNARVYDGDLITVEAIAPISVTVSGEVKTPGVLAVPSDATLVDAIARAGGPTALGTLSNISIRHRSGSSEAIDLHDTYTKGSAAAPIYLRDDDYIVIPKSERLVYVMGAVAKPDYYAVPVREILTVGQALSLAGGPIVNAKLSQVAVLHPTAQGVERRVINLNQKEGETLNIAAPVRPGDVVYVPEGAPSRSTWDKITAAVGALSLFRVF